MQRREIVNGYWEHYRLSTSSDRADRLLAENDTSIQAAVELVDDAIDQGGCEAVELLEALADAAPTERALAFLGAGPIEALLRPTHEDVFNDAEASARRNGKLRSALRRAWFETNLPAHQAVRFRQFGPPL